MKNSVQQNKRNRSIESELNLTEQMNIKSDDDCSWFRGFLNAIFSSPDLDYSQFVQLESKKTRHQIELSRWD